MEQTQENQTDLVPSAVQEFDFDNQMNTDFEFGLELPVMEFEDLGLTDL